MAFNFEECMKAALIEAIGHKPDFEIIIAAGEWLKLKKFTETDVAEIQEAIDSQYIAEEIPTEETIESED